MSCLVDDPKSSNIAILTTKFTSFIAAFAFTDSKQVITILAATIAAFIASSNNARENLTEVEEYIEDRVALMANIKEKEGL